MYQTGSLIIYGTTGVCRVTGVTQLDFSGHGTLVPYYTLAPLYQTGVIYAPVDNPKVFMRPVISKETAQQLIDQIPSIQAEAFHSRSPQELSEHYTHALQSHDCGDLIRLVMSIYTKKQDLTLQKRKFGQVDGRFMKQAEDLLYGEFAAALGIDKDRVAEYIAEKVDPAPAGAAVD